jgi:hypothetical protein
MRALAGLDGMVEMLTEWNQRKVVRPFTLARYLHDALVFDEICREPSLPLPSSREGYRSHNAIAVEFVMPVVSIHRRFHLYAWNIEPLLKLCRDLSFWHC